MPVAPALTLLGNIISSDGLEPKWLEDDGWADSYYRWTLNINVSIQTHSYGPDLYYSGDDIKVGMWIAAVANSRCVQIINVVSHTWNNVVVEVEDVDRYNTQTDPSQGGIGELGTGDCLIFNLNEEGVPVFANLSTTYSFFYWNNPTIDVDIHSRFAQRNLFKNFVRVEQASHGLSVNNQIYLDSSGVYHKADNTANNPVIGVVTSVGTPGVDWFSYRPNGERITNISPSLPGSIGGVLYLNSTGGLTATKPTSNAIPRMIKISNTEGIELFNAVTAADSTTLRIGKTPVGDKNGSNDTWTLPDGESYKSGTLAVILNGMQLDSGNVVQNGPGYTTFTISGDNLPESVDSFLINYVKG